MNSENVSGKNMKTASRLFIAFVFTCILSIAGYSSCIASTVVLQWQAVSDSDLGGYKVYYQADSSTQPFQGTGATQGAAPLVVPKSLNQTSATISGLDPAHAYNFAVTAYNASGVESVYSNIVSVPELVSPTVSLTSPANNASVSGTVSLNAGASDNVGVTKVEFYVNGTLKATDTSTPYLYSWDTASLAAGSYTLMAKAYDAAGNVGQSVNVPVTVVNDTTAPAVSMTAPANNATVSGSVTISATASDIVGVTKVEFYLDGALLTATNVSPFSYSWNTTSATNTAHTLYAKAYDAMGNVGQCSSITVTVNNPLPDTTDPTVTTFTLPTSSTSLSVPVSLFTATDNVGVTGYCITTSNSSTGCAWSGTAPSSVTFVGTGTRSAWGWAKDAANNISAGVSASTNITMSSLNIGETSILSSDDSGNGNLLLAQSATLAQTATIQSMSFYVATASGNLRLGIYDATGSGGGPGNLLASTTEITPTTGWNTANVATPVSLNAGTYWLAYLPSSSSLHFRLNNTAGTAKLYSFTYGAMPSTFSASPTTITSHWSFYATLATTTDNVAPTVSISAPADNATVSGTVSVTASASDNVGVTKVEYYVNGILSSTDTASPYSFSWNTALVTNNTYTLSAKAYDAAGKVGQSSNVTVTVNNPDITVPTTSITAPANSATLSGTVSVTATASDNIAVSKVEFYLNGVLSTTDTTNTYSYSWNTTSVANGSYTLSAIAYDAANNVGQSTNVTVTVSNITVTTPGAPTIGTATAGNGQATISFTAPASNGGSAITGYTVTSSPGGVTKTGTASPITVTGLTNGTAYTFTVKATNALGTGTASAASNSVTPSTTPGAPAIGTATAGNAQATISFTAPTSNGGSAITSYKVTSSPGSVTATGTVSPITVTGLTNGTAYTFSVTATNATGTGTASAASNSVIPATTPGAPTIGTATAGNAQTTISFTAPASNGGSAITGYTVTSSPGGVTKTGTASPITVTGLTNGTAYTFTVKATNTLGTGTASAASNSVTPATTPGSPTIGTAIAGNAQATISFTAPASNGGSAITSYKVTSSSGSVTATGTASPITVTGLTNGTAYTFSVTATNATGTGAASAASNSVTPAVASNPPSISIISPLNGAKYGSPASIILTASATANGTATITKVEFYNGANLLKTLTTSPYKYSWSNVSTGTYTVTAKAYDSTGAVSVSTPVTVNVVSPVKAVTISAGSPSSPRPVGTSVTFNASASGGSGSYQYQFMVKKPVTGWSTAKTYSTNSSFTWNTAGLTAGTYYIQVWARNTGSTASYETYKGTKYVLK